MGKSSAAAALLAGIGIAGIAVTVYILKMLSSTTTLPVTPPSTPGEPIVAPLDSVDLTEATYEISDLTGTDRFVDISVTAENIYTAPVKFYLTATFYDGSAVAKRQYLYVGDLASADRIYWTPQFKFELADRLKTYLLEVTAYQYDTFSNRCSDKMEASMYIA